MFSPVRWLDQIYHAREIDYMPKVAFIQKEAYEKLSVHYLAGALRAAGIECDIFIKDLEPDFYEKLLKFDPAYVVFSLYIEEEDIALEFFRKIKSRSPHVKTLLGGPFTLTFEDIVKKIEVDYVFRGDGEKSLLKFIELIEEGKDIEGVTGISFLDEDESEYRNEHIELVDVNSVKPDRDIYYKYEILRNNPTKIFIASRGCPYRCTFCYNAELARFYDSPYWRQRNIDDVISEIRYVKERYGVKWIHFQDGTFNANKKWLFSFLQAYSEASLPPFLVNARPEHIDEESIKLFQKAGCDRMTFGIQSGNSRVRTEIAGRSMTNEQIIDACKLCKQYGIRVNVDLIFGWPSETVDEAMDTIRLCRQADVETYSSNVLVFYPGLRVTRYAYENAYIEKIPTLAEVHQLDFNKSLLLDKKNKLFVNMDKLFYYFIKVPSMEPVFLALLTLPPNRLFCLVKNLQMFRRKFKYGGKSRLRTIVEFLKDNWIRAT
jgi:anaerobic magnesium-protoporphyrin IX monomethyl ester cyclase